MERVKKLYISLVMQIQDSIESNQSFLINNINVGETGALGTAQLLARVGCKEIVELPELEDNGKYYIATVKDKKGKEYTVSMSYSGYAGVIKDSDSKILYAPVD